ncbi:hypothetical protein JTE90_015927 [Oedothorax gibbosus]|uniref:CUB domain-containing protein n=1 Tax=Oedothorax gibbosus TaxID=931172 RepID=A0AAV6U172_9ARAC|nr:hypothetical protein JTE90_015927 [Oedothorax gibbosus]
MNFKKYRLAKPNDCEQNFIQLYDGRTPDKNLALFCGTSSEPQKSDSNMTHVRLFTHRDAFNGTDFQLHYTSFSEINASAGKKQCDPRTEFNCGDQTCIDVLLKCDGEFDCKYRYDEEATLCTRELGTGTVLTSEHMIIILVVFFSLVAAMCASISISCYNKIRDRRMREREYKERRSKEASVEVTLSSVPPPRPAQRAERMADDESSDGGGCYVPEVDMSVFSNNKQQQRPNGGDTIPKSKLRQQPHAQHYPYISESFESLASDVIVPPAPPPVPSHMRPRRDPSPPPPSYRIVAGKVVAANPVAKSIEAEPLMSSSRASTLDHNNSRNEVDPKSSWLRGPLESGAPSRTPYEPASRYKGGMSSRVTPAGPSTGGARGPLGSAYKVQGPRPYQPTPVGDASDSSRAHSVASTLSAPDALLGKR